MIMGGKKMNRQELYVTITGFKHYYGKKPFAIGKRLLCKKDFNNEYDDDAIEVILGDVGTIGYIANSPYTKAEGTLSAGRIYDKVDDMFYVEVMFMTASKVICKVLSFPVEQQKGRYKRRALTKYEDFEGERPFCSGEGVPF